MGDLIRPGNDRSPFSIQRRAHLRLSCNTSDENCCRKEPSNARHLATSLMKRARTLRTGRGLNVDALIVPETKPLDDLLADLQRQRPSMGVVVDEYGRVVGVVTVEDIIEEVVGEIADETDPSTGEIRRLADGDWFVRGHVAVTDLADYGLNLPVDSDAYNSIGGFVFPG